MFTKILDEEIRIKEILKKDDPIIVECGANQGRTTKGFLERFPHVKLFCFEPDPRNIVKFKKNIQDSRCELIEAAVSHVDGKVLLMPSSGHRPGQPSNFEDTDSSTIKGTVNHVKLYPWIKYKKPVKVKTITLDTWRKEQGIEDIDFIWADVEGAEEEMLKGARETLRHTHYFYTEFSDDEAYDKQINLQEIQRYLPGFVMVKCWEKDVLFRNKLWGKGRNEFEAKASPAFVEENFSRKFLTNFLCNHMDFFISKSLVEPPCWPVDIRSHLLTLFSIVISLNAKEVLEIGVREGYSTLALNSAVGLTGGVLTSIDIEKPRLKFQLPFWENWLFIQSDSIDFLNNLESTQRFDLVFIDGKHTYNQVKQEFDLISKHVNKSSLILFHDTMPGTYPEYSSGEAAQPAGFLGGGPLRVIFELDKTVWEYCTIPVSHGLTIVRKYK